MDNKAAVIAATITARATSTANIANGCRIRDLLPKLTPTRWRCQDREGGTRSDPRCRFRPRRQRSRQHPRRHSPPIFPSCRSRWQYSLCSRLNSMWPTASKFGTVVIPPRGNYSTVLSQNLNHVLSSDPNFLVVVIFNIVKNSFLARLRNQGITLIPYLSSIVCAICSG